MDKEKLFEQLKNYENKWVAILEPEKKVVASGSDASEAKQKAEEGGYKNFVLFRVFPFRAGYVPFL